MRLSVCATLILAGIILCGCNGSSGKDPTQPGQDTAPLIGNALEGRQLTESSQRIWGVWRVNVAENHDSAEAIPLRAAEFHVNVLSMLEGNPPARCLSLDRFTVDPEGIISMIITLWHPYPGNYRLTGYDVRGIIITGSDYSLPASGRRIAWGDDLPVMIYPDGYTPLFNPSEYPESSASPLLTYTTGRLAWGANLSSTLNPYMAYFKDRSPRYFQPGDHDTQTFRLYAPDGAFSFGYAVSARWVDAGNKANQPIKYFPPEAKCPEAYRIDTMVWPDIQPSPGSQASLFVEVHDLQGADTISSVTAECPALFGGEIELGWVPSYSGGPVYYSLIANTLGAGRGTYPLLVHVDDTEHDPLDGPTSAWTVRPLRVGSGWIRTWGGTNNEDALDLAVSDEGQIYVLGSSAHSSDMNPGPRYVPCSGDVYLSRFSPEGTLEWALFWDTGIEALALDSSNCIFLAGTLWYATDLDPGPSEYILEPTGYHDAFLLKLDSDGNFLWARQWGGVMQDSESPECWSSDLAVDNDGNILVIGWFTETVDFDPGPGEYSLTSDSEGSHFLSKLDRYGNFLWVRHWGDEWGSLDGMRAAATDTDDVVLLGGFYQSVDLDPSAGTDWHTAVGNGDLFLSRLSSSGEYLWGVSWGSDDYDEIGGLAIADSDTIYVSGELRGIADLDPGPGILMTGLTGCYAGYVSRFNGAGELEWTRAWPCENQLDASGIVSQTSGNVCVLGSFRKWVDLEPGPSTSVVVARGDWDCYLSLFGPDGSFISGFSWGGPKRDHCGDIALAPSDDILVLGSFHGVADLNPTRRVEEYTAIHNVYYPGFADSFLIRLLPDGTL